MEKKKLLKIALLAVESPVEGERDAAKTVLAINGITDPQSFLHQNSSTKEVVDINGDDETILSQVTYKTTLEKELIFQTFFRITNAKKISYYQYGPRRVSISIKRGLELDFQDAVTTIIGLWRQELTRFHESFIQANQLYSTHPATEEDQSRLTTEELLEILELSRSIKRATIGKLFENE